MNSKDDTSYALGSYVHRLMNWTILNLLCSIWAWAKIFMRICMPASLCSLKSEFFFVITKWTLPFCSLQRNRMCISMELVTAVLGDHGQRPLEDYGEGINYTLSDSLIFTLWKSMRYGFEMDVLMLTKECLRICCMLFGMLISPDAPIPVWANKQFFVPSVTSLFEK